MTRLLLVVSLFLAGGAASAQTIQAGLLQCSTATRTAKSEYRISGLSCGSRYCSQRLSLPIVDHAFGACKARAFDTPEQDADVILSGFKVNRAGGGPFPVHGLQVFTRLVAFSPSSGTVDVDLYFGMPTFEAGADETYWAMDVEVLLTTGTHSRLVRAEPGFSTQPAIAKGVVALPAGTVPPGWTFGEFSFGGLALSRVGQSGSTVQHLDFDARDPRADSSGAVSGIIYLGWDDGFQHTITGDARVVALIGDPNEISKFEHSHTYVDSVAAFGQVDTKARSGIYTCGLRRMRVEATNQPTEVWALWGGWQTLECGFQPSISVYRTPYLLFLSDRYYGPPPVPDPEHTVLGTPGVDYKFDQTANGTRAR
ncbi:MAG: hypothetical protein HY906_06360 [Deltaproteobacteria bacterium]|nr:hypothetical protein [Deltaproteobacteria bacterium]